MIHRVAVVALLLLCLPLAVVKAQDAVSQPALTLSPRSGDLSVSRTLHGAGFAPSSVLHVVIFDPSGNQQVIAAQTDASGTFDLPLAPPNGQWDPGLYRAAVPLDGGRSVSATFGASDGTPHLYARPYLPSPTSAFNFVGVGLPPGTTFQLHLLLTGGQEADVALPVTADDAGLFSIYVWPEQFGLPFFAAGNYLVELPDLGLGTAFSVREHAVGGHIVVDGAIPAGAPLQARFGSYDPNRYLWGVYAGMNGVVLGEFLIGPTDIRGNIDGALALPALSGGRYLIATPYDWGETEFTVIPPTPTATATPTQTPTPTATATPTATPKPTPIHHKRKRHRRRHP